MNAFLFLDIDGVLNDHLKHPNKVCGLKPSCVREMNRVLDKIPSLQIVVSSAWRYYFHSGYMTLIGLEAMFQTHGLNCYKRIHGVTRPDGKVPIELGGRTWDQITEEEKHLLDNWGPIQRAEQIRDYINEHSIKRYAVVDDIPLPIEPLVQTHRDIGLTVRDANRLLELLKPNRKESAGTDGEGKEGGGA